MTSNQIDWKSVIVSVACSLFLTMIPLLLLHRRRVAANNALIQYIVETAAGQVAQLRQLMEQLKALPSPHTDDESARIKSMIVAELSSAAMQECTKKLIHDEVTRSMANMIEKDLLSTQDAHANKQTNVSAAISDPPPSVNVSTSSARGYIISVVQSELATTLPSVITWDRCLRTLEPIAAGYGQLIDEVSKVKDLSQHATAVDALRIVQNNLLSSIQTYQAKLGSLDNLLEHINKAKASGEAIRSILKAADKAKKDLDNMLDKVEAKQAEYAEREEQLALSASNLASTRRLISDSNQQVRSDADGALKAYSAVHGLKAELNTILEDARYQRDEINRILEEIREGRDKD